MNLIIDGAVSYTSSRHLVYQLGEMAIDEED